MPLHYGYFWDPSYLILIPAIIFSLYAQIRVKSVFAKYEATKNFRGYTGSEVVRMILDNNGLSDIRIEHVIGSLTDHYDPRAKVIRLSDTVYDSSSVAAIGVAAHEAGHAVQYATNYSPIKIRNAVIPITNIGSRLAVPLVVFGLIFSAFQFLIPVGIFLFCFVVFFQAVTLPVEFNASKRALETLKDFNILEDDELKKSKAVLNAAAMTYVAALAASLLSLLRLLLLVNRRRN